MNEKLIRSIKEHPAKYARAIGFTLLNDTLHNEWIKQMMFVDAPHTTILGHRGSYKTSCLSVAFALLIVLRPDKTIFFIRKTDDDVIEIVAQVQKILKSDIMQYIVREIYGVDLVLTTASAYKIDTNLNTSSRGQVQLQGMGLNGSITGKHADLVFTDDIVNVKDRVSKAEREQTKRQYQELQNIVNRGGRIFNTGTPWHKEDCISTLMPNVHRYTVYDTGLITTEQQTHLRGAMSPSLYAANYELKHIADADALFSAPNWLTDADTELIYGGSAHCDAAYSGSDYTAYTIMHKLRDGRIIAYGKMWRKHVDDCLPTIVALHEQYRAGSVAMETNGDKGYAASNFDDAGLPTQTYAEHMNKYIKISSYLRKNWSNIYWIADTDPEYISQILDYTEHADHDDAPDSAASLLREMDEMITANTDSILRGGII